MSRYDLTIGGTAYTVDVVSIAGSVATVMVNGVPHQVQIGGAQAGSPARAPAPMPATTATPQPVPAAAAEERAQTPAADAAAARVCIPCVDVNGELVCAPMPGSIVNLLVGIGDAVQPGATLLIMEAMKMENEINAPSGGTVVAIHVEKGQTVKVNQPLVVIGP